MPTARRVFRSRRRALGLNWRWGVIAVVAALAVATGVVGILDYGANLFRAAPVAIGEPAPTFALENTAALASTSAHTSATPAAGIAHGAAT